MVNNNHLTTDKLMTLENWTHIFSELDPILASEASSTKKSKTFDIDSGRLNVKAKWVRINDSSDVGSYIVKICNLSSSSVGKHFLKIEIKLSSYLERITSQLEQKNKSVDGKSSKSKEPNHHPRTSSKEKNFHHRKISDIFKPRQDSPSLFNEAATADTIDEFNAGDSGQIEEYIPMPTPGAACTFSPDTHPTYKPEKSCAQVHPEYSPTPVVKIENSPEENAVTPPAVAYHPENKPSEIELNKIKSEYSPSYMTDKIQNEDVVYRPSTKPNKSAEKSKKLHVTSKELFGDDSSDDDTSDKVSSSSQKSKRRLDLSPKRGKRLDNERAKSKKKKPNIAHNSETGEVSIR